MKILIYQLTWITLVVSAQAQEAERRAEGVIQDEAWVLRSSQPTQQVSLEYENTQWMLETSARHWSGKGEMTPQELDKLRSIYQNEDGKQKIDAFSIITFVEGIESWEADLVQMLYSSEKAYVQSGLNVLSAKMIKGSELEKKILFDNEAIVSRVSDLQSLWVEDSNIQGKVKHSLLALDRVSSDIGSGDIDAEVRDVEQVDLAAVAQTIVPVTEGTTPSEQILEESERSTKWFWLIGAVLVLISVVSLYRAK